MREIGIMSLIFGGIQLLVGWEGEGEGVILQAGCRVGFGFRVGLQCDDDMVLYIYSSVL
jgi:hypothetical protein